MQSLGSPSDGRFAHDQRVLSWLSPDLRAAAQSQHERFDPELSPRQDAARDHPCDAERSRVSRVLLRQFSTLREFANTEREDPLGSLHTSAAHWAKLSRSAQPPDNSF